MAEDEYKRIFAKNLRYYMEQNNKNQMDLMQDLNLSSSTVSNWCTGLKLPRMDKVQMLADYFGILKSDLIEEKNLPNQSRCYNKEIGIKLKQRRLELELTVDDLATMIGKSRATIYRYENGDIESMPTTVLEPLALALQTTPAYLMGWKENMFEDSSSDIAMNLFKELNDEGQERAIDNMMLLKKVYPRVREPLLNAAHERTDIEVTDEMRQHDDDIMDDENF